MIIQTFARTLGEMIGIGIEEAETAGIPGIAEIPGTTQTTEVVGMEGIARTAGIAETTERLGPAEALETARTVETIATVEETERAEMMPLNPLDATIKIAEREGQEMKEKVAKAGQAATGAMTDTAAAATTITVPGETTI